MQKISSLLTKFKSFNKFSVIPKATFAAEPPQNPKVIPQVSDRIVWINIENFGNFQRIPAYEGETLLEAFRRSFVFNIPGTCQGGEDINTMTEKPIDPVTYGPFCNTCHILVSDPWRNKMGEVHLQQAKQLTRSPTGMNSNSRLACCVLVEKWMNQMVVVIAENKASIHEAFN